MEARLGGEVVDPRRRRLLKSWGDDVEVVPEFVVTSRLLVSGDEATPFRADHLSFMARLKSEGKLRMAGRFSDGKGGMYILIAKTLPEATALADADPYHANHVRGYDIREWEQRF